MKPLHYGITTAITSFILLTACQSTAPTVMQPESVEPAPIIEPTPAAKKPDYSQTLYLRAVFNWWDTQPEYKVEQVDVDLYRAKAKLVADGKYYDFKFADEDWTPGMSCGFENEAQAIIVENSESVPTNCDVNGAYFKFKPKKTGSFYFYFDHRGDKPLVYIKRIE